MPTSKKIALLAVALAGAFVLFWRLGDRYLWQDEAATAVLAQRVLEYGRPLAFDGVNLVTLDHFGGEDLSTIDQRTRSAKAALAYYLQRGDYKPDTTWKWQPWGQFFAAAASLRLFGSTAWAARLPFALAGLAALILLYRLVEKDTEDPLVPIFSSLLLAFNGQWALHARQCRYYALSSLCLVVTLLAFRRWRGGGRWGSAAFVAAAWCWFQVDYGTVWPVLAVLFGCAVAQDLTTPRGDREKLGAGRLRSTFGVGLALAATLAPFVAYYELWGRLAASPWSWTDRFAKNLSNVNLYVSPMIVLVGAAALLAWKRRELGSTERRLLTVSLLVVTALLVWVPSTAPEPFVRYVVLAAPVGCFLAAWSASRLARAVFPASRSGSTLLASALVVLLAFTSWFSWPASVLLRGGSDEGSYGLRPGSRALYVALFEERPDPNRAVVEWLRAHAAPTDPILVNYEDLPLVFYLKNPVRGGLVAFAAEDASLPPPRYLVLRRSVSFCYWPAYNRQVDAFWWEPVPVAAPDIRWGNNPDPLGTWEVENAGAAPPLVVARRLDGA